MPTRKIFQIVVLCAMGYVLLIGDIVSADIIVAPNDFSNFSTPAFANAYPFNAGFAGQTSMRYQQVYDASQFSSLSGSTEFTAMAFRVGWRTSDGASMTLPNIQINLSTTSVMPDGFSRTFSQNVGADDKVVYSGSLTLSTAYRGEPISADGRGWGPNVFDVIIYLQSPFMYDPQMGNLLLDVRNFNAIYNDQFSLDCAQILGDSVSRIGQIDVNSLTGNPDTGGLVTEFFTGSSTPILPPPVPFPGPGPGPTPVPEPSTMLLLGSGLLGLVGLRWKFKK